MLQDVKAELQTSDAELEVGLREMRVLVLNGELRPITLGYLNTILELILNTLVLLSASTDDASVLDIIDTLQADHDISPDVSRQVMPWFGRINSSSRSETWNMDVDAVVRQLGLGILSVYRVCHSSGFSKTCSDTLPELFHCPNRFRKEMEGRSGGFV